MMIDNISGMSSYQAPDVKVEKETEASDIRPIEEPGDGNESQLDLEKQAISKKSHGQQQSNGEQAVLGYDAKGEIVRDSYEDIDQRIESQALDLIA